jgi:hypothetical protein
LTAVGARGQQAPGFCAQKSSNFWASEPAGGAAAPPAALPLAAPPVPPPELPPPLSAVTPEPPLDGAGVVAAVLVLGAEAVAPDVPDVPVDPVAPDELVAVGVGVGVAEPLSAGLAGWPGAFGIGAATGAPGTSGASG